MLKALGAAKVPVKGIKMNPHKQQPITGALQALLSKDSALKVSMLPSSSCVVTMTYASEDQQSQQQVWRCRGLGI